MLQELLLQAVREPCQLAQAGPLYSAEDTEAQSNRAKAIWLLRGRGACAETLDVTKGGPCKVLPSLTSLGS